MKVRFIDGFKLQLVAENQLERLFMIEWEAKSKIQVDDLMRMSEYHVNPEFIDWEYKPNESGQ